MEEGYLTVHAFTGDRLLPVPGAEVIIISDEGKIVHELITDENGYSPTVSLGASSSPEKPREYTVKLRVNEGLREAVIRGVSIFPGITSTLPVQMYPLTDEENTPVETIIPGKRGVELRDAKEEHHINPAMLLALSVFRRR